MDWSAIEEKTFDVGVHEVLNLSKCSLVSKTPLTETLLKHTSFTLPLRFQGSSTQSHEMEPKLLSEGRTITIKIFISKSKNVVYYAEAGEDFVDLLFSFLTFPLGFVLNKVRCRSFNGCADRLYNSIWDLDGEHYLKSDEHKEMLVNPKVAAGFHYKNQLLNIEGASHPQYYFGRGSYAYDSKLTTDKTLISAYHVTPLTVLDPKSNLKEASNGGFVEGPTMFSIIDNLLIEPISSVSVLKKLNVPFNDIKECIVHVGNAEATGLLVASFLFESALTNAFIKREPNQR